MQNRVQSPDDYEIDDDCDQILNIAVSVYNKTIDLQTA